MASGSPVQKWNLMMAIQRDGSLSDGARRTAMFLLDRHNYRTGRCFPSYGTIAKDIGADRSTAIRHIKSLIDAGWIFAEKADAKGGFVSNNFVFAWGRCDAQPSGTAATSPSGECATTLVANAPPPSGNRATRGSRNPATPPSGTSATLTYEDITCESLTCEGNLGARPSGSLTDHAPRTIDGPAEQSSCDDDCPTLPLAIIEPSRAVTRANARRSPSSVGLETFPEWYAQFPRKVSRGNAEKAYAKIIKSGEATPAELLAGAMRYAAAVAGTEPRYIKHPASWLNAKGWLDEPEPQSWRSDPPSRADSAIQGIKNYLIRTGELS